MEIKNLSASMVNAYKSVAQTASRKETAKSGGKSNVDKIEFDFSRAVSVARQNTASAIDDNASAEKISSLQAKYAEENCDVPSTAVAEAIIGQIL